ncbi:MAG TPA: hypothetical protein ENF73_00160, partial [Proteobacteria bacterium]|nr:hypothetical protein [Pseudomonadota bacterium]
MRFRTSVAVAFFLLFVFVVFTKGWASPEELARVQRYIEENGLEWVAKETWISRLPEEERSMYLGGYLYEPPPEDAIFYEPPKGEKLPSHFDWRDYNGGNWMTPVKNQGYCGACAAFSAIGAFEAVINIANGDPDIDLDLSEQHLVSCAHGSCYSGMTIDNAMNYLKNYGTPLESCFPYTAGQSGVNPPCSNTCSDWQSQARRVNYWGYVPNNITSIKSAIYNHGPVAAAVFACDDWYYYQEGEVYSHPGSCSDCTPHGIVIMGWDDAGQYWIIKNSWTAAWGEGGYMRIKWGTCGIDTVFPVIYMTYTPRPDDSGGDDVCDDVCYKLRYCGLTDVSESRCLDWCIS